MIQARALQFLSGSAPAGQDLLAWMEMRRELNHYRQLILYDARAKQRLSVPPNLSSPNTPQDQDFQAALRARGILATDWPQKRRARDRLHPCRAPGEARFRTTLSRFGLQWGSRKEAKC